MGRGKVWPPFPWEREAGPQPQDSFGISCTPFPGSSPWLKAAVPALGRDNGSGNIPWAGITGAGVSQPGRDVPAPLPLSRPAALPLEREHSGIFWAQWVPLSSHDTGSYEEVEPLKTWPSRSLGSSQSRESLPKGRRAASCIS